MFVQLTGSNHPAEKLGSGETDEQTALLAIGRSRVAKRALEERTEDIADTNGGSANADRRETGTDNLSGSEIHVITPWFEL